MPEPVAATIVEDELSHVGGESLSLESLKQRPRAKGLLKVGEQWFHLSTKYPTLKLRPLGEDSVDETRMRILRLDQPAAASEVAEMLGGARFFAGWSVDEAALGRDQILDLREPPRDSTDQPSKIVPITRLRRFYETLRTFGSRAACLALLEAAIRKPKDFEKLFAASYLHFAGYSNTDEPFVDPGTSRVRVTADDDLFARRLLARLRSGWSDGSDLAFDFVDYEVSPLRTTKSRFEDGRRARSSGGGGMDLLLRSRASGLPIIGEIKAMDDTNLFVALVQSLTYAVELTTPTQRRRLKHHGFTLDDAPNAQGPFADVYIMYERGTDEDIRRGVFELVTKLRALPDSRMSRTIRRIEFLECNLGDPDSLRRVPNP